jgi:predicted transglutaminase-like cysteine proteinase
MESMNGLARGMLAAAASVMFLSGALPASANASMATGRQTSQPIGHYEFCKANPAECSIRGRDGGPVVLSSQLWERIALVNRQVNAAVKPMSDRDIYGLDEVWTYPDAGVGDCEDYVLEKRRQLHLDDGVELSNLLITVVRKPDGEGHAVLTVRTDQGDFILDNLNDKVKPWHHTGYRYLKRQASNHTGRWVNLVDDQNMLVGAVD